MALIETQPSGIGGFLDLIWREEEGYAYVATKVPGNPHQWDQHFFAWPQERGKVIDFIISQRAEYEVYFAPALFTAPEASKSFVKGSRVIWVEFDGKIPDDLAGVPNPSIRVRSSTEGHEHWYWRMDTAIEPYDLERCNRSLAYLLGADASGWDAGQVLRPIETLNHKRAKPVELLESTNEVFPLTVFSSLPEPPPALAAPVPDSIPDVPDVIAKYTFTPSVWKLFKDGLPYPKRSEAFMSLGYYLAEMQLTDEECFAMLLNADERWGKFKGRSDQYVRIMEVVVRARQKYPFVSKGKQSGAVEFQSIGFRSLLATEINLEWVWDGLLQKSGYMLITGPSGVGKTQFTLDAAAHIALGTPFLEREVMGAHKIGIFSLEMGLVDLKSFLAKQSDGIYSAEELDKLEQNCRIFPLGEPIYLNRDEEKRRIEAVVEKEGLTGIIIDSLGSTTEDELSKEKDVKNLMDWNDHFRQTTGAFTWFIHHHRKATGDNKRPNKLADVYGSQYITARATTVLCIWNAGLSNQLSLIPLKVRLTAQPEPFSIYRDSSLHFSTKYDGITLLTPQSEPDALDNEEEEPPMDDVTASDGSVGI